VLKYGECITLYSNGNGTWTYWVSFSIIDFTTNNYISGVLPYSYGGTGLAVLGSAGQQLRVNAGATALEYFTYAMTNGSGTTANGTAIDLGGTLSADATLSSNTFNFNIAHSTSSRNTRFSAAGNMQMWNGATSGQTTLEYNPSGYLTLPSVKINPTGATFTVGATLDIRGASTSVSDLSLRATGSGGVLAFAVTNAGTVMLDTITAATTTSAITYSAPRTHWLRGLNSPSVSPMLYEHLISRLA